MIGGIGQPKISENARNNSTSAEAIFLSCATLAAQAINSCGFSRGLRLPIFLQSSPDLKDLFYPLQLI